MKVLVTGGAGYIGSHLVDHLLSRGDEVFAIDNLSTGNIANIQPHLGQNHFHFLDDTILNENLLDLLVSQVDLVYHLAAIVGVKNVVADPLAAIKTNVTGTEVVLNAAFKYWKKVVLASTSEIYGKSAKIPFHEDDDRVLGPTTVGRWSYSTSKAIDEHFAFAYAAKGLSMAIVRYFNSYGPRLDEKGYGSVVANFARQALKGEPITVHGDGLQSRCFTYIDDTVVGTVLAGEVKAGERSVFNIGSDAETTVQDLALAIKRLSGSRSDIIFVPYRAYYGEGFEDTRRRVPSIDRAREVLGFIPKVKLEEGLMRTIAWCREHYTR
ncbi:MAG: GDP-mannose 4,6-dehydratase [candidate division NC10 bacterium]|nr:GDP-mannose 4,6-dehydratase [candidate division NC10 bacterium]